MTDLRYRYIIATQDRDLQESVRKVPGVPLFYLHQKVPTLEPPSPASQKKALEYRTTVGMNAQQAETIVLLKKRSGIAVEEAEKSVGKKKRKKKGPNPLSCKKKKKTLNSAHQTKDSEDKNGEKTSGGKIGKRKKIKIPKHVKEALKNGEI